jgi:hypothetical protein
MGFILFIFLLRYSSNVAFALRPEWRATLAVQVTLAVVLGLISGLSIGRTLGLFRLSRRAEPATATMDAHA